MNYPPPIRKTVAVCSDCFISGGEWYYRSVELAGKYTDCECVRLDGTPRRYVKRLLWFCGLDDCQNEDEYGSRNLAYRTRADAEHPVHRIAYTDAPLDSSTLSWSS